MARLKTEVINLRMAPETKALLRVAANREHRTLSNMIEHLLIDYCERHAISCAEHTDEQIIPNRIQTGSTR